MTGPPSAQYDDVLEQNVNVAGRDGADVACLRFQPRRDGPHPAVVIGAEATGLNEFIRRVGATLARHGYVVAIPDYYRGAGPADPEAYEDFEAIMEFLDALDFTRATADLLAAVDHLRTSSDVDPSQVSVWGYCTGATLALLAAELDRQISSAVLFFPSQPVFERLTDTTPVHPMDLLWCLECPTLVIYGDADVVMPPERLAELRRRLEVWQVDHSLLVYPGAGHAFCAEVPSLFHEQAAAQSWSDALAFLLQHTAQHTTQKDRA